MGISIPYLSPVSQGHCDSISSGLPQLMWLICRHTHCSAGWTPVPLPIHLFIWCDPPRCVHVLESGKVQCTPSHSVYSTTVYILCIQYRYVVYTVQIHAVYTVQIRTYCVCSTDKCCVYAVRLLALTVYYMLYVVIQYRYMLCMYSYTIL